MPEYEIEDILVQFPFDAYPCQIKYMERVIACLNKGWNGVLESPTGTGKTLCLLCSCLAWQQNRKRLLMEEAMAQLACNFPTSTQSVGQTKTNQCIAYPKILYTSRTHMQLSQVIRELNKTAYKTVKTCLLGSRDQLCLHEDVRNEENSTIKNHMCRAKVKTRTCHYYNGFDAYQNAPKLPADNDSKDAASTTALDMEDFISFGRRNKICPFFASRDKPEEADLILMPYNYVVDSKARKANKIDLNNVILIFDEAHNLEKICEESASITFATKDLAGSLRESKEALNMIMVEEEAVRREMDDTKLPFGMAINDLTPQINIDTKELGNLILLMESLEKELDKIDFQKRKASSSSSLPGITLPGDFILNLLQQAGIQAYLRDDINSLVDKVTSYLTSKATNAVWQSRGVSLQKFASFLNTVFSSDGTDTTGSLGESDISRDCCRHFKVYISTAEEEKRTSTALNNFVKSNIPRRQHLQLNYWCFNAGITMESLAERGVSSFLVTSGTLSPMNHFIAEMKIPFQLTLQNDHVIQSKQAWFGAVCQGPDGCVLDASYANRQNDSYVNSLGNMLVNVFRLVPDGCLVFFASYSQMNSCIEKWQNGGIWNRMSNHKALYIEPKSKEEFYRVIGEYNTMVKLKPAAFFAVCRGKISEGTDFADSSARAVVIMGIPYPPMMEARVILKKEFLNGQQRPGQSSNAHCIALDGDTWYRTEAIRAVNQAIGRVIRHKDDYGAVILADQRFTQWARDRFPLWIVPNYNTYTKFGEFSKSLAEFFKDKMPKKENFTAIKPTEYAFEKVASTKQVDFDEKRRIDAMFNPKKCKSVSESTSVASNSNGYHLNAYASVATPVARNPQQHYGNMWDALEYGNQAKEVHTFAPYNPDGTNRSHPKDSKTNRPKIIIKRDATESNARCGETSSSDGQSGSRKRKSANEIDPDKRHQSDEFRKMAKQRLNTDQFARFYALVKNYKDDYRFEPLLTFLRTLPYHECSSILQGFIPFVRSQHKSAYMAFLDEATKSLDDQKR